MAKRFLTPINLPSRSSDPATASEGDLYFNTSLDVIKVYYNSVWNPISSETIFVSDTPPVSHTEGQLWYESDSGDLFIRYDNAWVQTGGSGGGGISSVAMTVPTGLSVSGSPITSSGTLAVSLASGYEIPTTAALAAKAPLASPTFTGTPAAPTATIDTNTTQVATTAFVLGQASGSNPLALGTVAQGTSTRYARQDHVHPTTGLALLAGSTFTGTIITPAATTSISSIRIPHGTAPTAPTNGDIWTTTAGLFARINGGTVGPYGIGTARTFYQTTAPGSPSTGDIWVDSDEVYTTINSNDFMPKSGGTFTGSVSGTTPSLAAHLTTKSYVDTAVAAAGGGGLDGFFTGCL